MEYERQETTIENITFAHDLMFKEVMQHTDIAKRFIEDLLDRQIESIQLHETQFEIKNRVDTRATAFDVLFVGDNRYYNIEMQRGSQRALLRRARYHQSNLDGKFVKNGVRWEELPETYIIFLCMFDHFGAGYDVYFVEPSVTTGDGAHIKIADGKGNGSHLIVLNAKYRHPTLGGSTLGVLDYPRDSSTAVLTPNLLVQDIDAIVQNSKESSEFRRRLMSLEEYVDERANERVAAKHESDIRALIENLGLTREQAEKALSPKAGSITKLRLT